MSLRIVSLLPAAIRALDDHAPRSLPLCPAGALSPPARCEVLGAIAVPKARARIEPIPTCLGPEALHEDTARRLREWTVPATCLSLSLQRRSQTRLDLARGVLFLRARGAIRAPAAWNAP
jgi:hypothetical protein